MHRVNARFIDGYAFLEVSVARRPWLWLIDTGASVCVVDASLAAKLTVAPSGGAPSSMMISGAVAQRQPIVHVAPMTVVAAADRQRAATTKTTSSTSRNIVAIVQDLTPVWRTVAGGNRVGGSRLAGILGYTWLRRHIVRIGYVERRVWLANAADARAPSLVASATMTPLRSRLNERRLTLVDAQLDRLPHVGETTCGDDTHQRRRAPPDATWWVVDTGADASLVGAGAVRRWQLYDGGGGGDNDDDDQTQRVSFTLADGVGNDLYLVPRRFDSLTLRAAGRGAVVARPSPPMLLDVDGVIEAVRCDAVGTLGNELWRRARAVWLDYRPSSSAIVWLER